MSKPVGRVEISFVDPINNFCIRGFANIKYLSKLCVFSLRNITFEFHDTSTITNVFVFINVNKTKIRQFQKHWSSIDFSLYLSLFRYSTF